MTPGRRLTLAVGACAVAAGAALLAAGRQWVLTVIPRPAPLPDELVAQTGGDLRPWLPALAWAALAGAGALLATRGWVRRGLGGLLAASGAGIAVGAGSALAMDTVEPGWPVVAAVAGLVVSAVGVVTGFGSGDWPAMGARYERAARATADRARTGSTGADDAGGGLTGTEQWWDALDQGRDPTG